jgi:hypothetical protein
MDLIGIFLFEREAKLRAGRSPVKRGENGVVSQFEIPATSHSVAPSSIRTVVSRVAKED